MSSQNHHESLTLAASKPLSGEIAKPVNQYSTRPQWPLPNLDAQAQPAKIPSFANTIRLRTFDSNLNLEFAFAKGLNQSKNTDTEPLANVMLSSQTAKQLLFALAELFQCDIVPKG